MTTKGMSDAELACVYAALILQDDDITITGEKIQTLLDAAHVEVESFWPGLYAKALEGCDVKALITNVSEGVASGGGGGAPASATIAAPAEEAKVEEKKEEKKDTKDDKGSSSESEGGFGGMFDD